MVGHRGTYKLLQRAGCPLLTEPGAVFLHGEEKADALGVLRSVQPTRLFAPASFWISLRSALYEHLEDEVLLPAIVTRTAARLRQQQRRNYGDEHSEEHHPERGCEESVRDKSEWKSSKGGKEKREQPSSFTIGRRSTAEANLAKRQLNVKEVAKNQMLLDLYKQHMGLVRLCAGYSSFTPLPPKVLKLFQKLNICIYEIYAHPYATGFISCNQLRPPLCSESEEEDEEATLEIKAGTVGAALGHSKVKLDTEHDPPGYCFFGLFLYRVKHALNNFSVNR